MKHFRFGTRKGMWTVLSAIAVIAMAATWTMAKPAKSLPAPEQATGGNLSKALLVVNNMSCGGCVDTITKSLAVLPGIADISVDVAGGTAEVMFNPELLPDHQKIASTITDAGYPATISRIYTAREVREAASTASERAKTHIASVGRLDIPRQDYAFELGHARKRYEQVYGKDVFTTGQGRQLLQRVKTQIALRLVDEGIKLQEVERAGYTIPDVKIKEAMDQYLSDRKTTLQQLKSDLEANDYPFSYFQEKFSRKVRLQSYLEDKVFGDSIDADARQQQYINWLSNARTLAKVTYYDKALEKLIKAGGGSSCSGGGCSASR